MPGLYNSSAAMLLISCSIALVPRLASHTSQGVSSGVVLVGHLLIVVYLVVNHIDTNTRLLVIVAMHAPVSMYSMIPPRV